MELLIPGIWVLLGAVIVAFGIVPRLGPTIVLLVAAAMLGLGVYHHYKLFHNEYRLATWTDKIRTYGPAVLIVAMVLFILGFIFSLFGGASVPLPNMNSSPVEEESPATPEESTSATQSPLESIMNTVKEGAQNIVNTANNARRSLGTSRLVNFGNITNGNNNNNGNRRNRNNYTPSFYSEV